MSHNPTYKIKS